MFDPAEAAALAAIAFAGALIFGITGFGSALVTIPLATHLVALPFALALFALADLTSTLRIGLQDRNNAVRDEWLRMVPAILAGTVIGVTVLVNLPRQAGMLALGAFIAGYAVFALLPQHAHRTVGRGWAWLAGLAGGVTSTLFGAGGPPYAVYLSRRGLTKEQYRATLGRCTTASISLRVLAFLATGILLDARVWLDALFAIPAVLLGIAVATRVFRVISREMLMRAVALLLLASGSSLILRALG